MSYHMLPRIGRDAENATDILESGGSKPRDLGGFSPARSIKVVPPSYVDNVVKTMSWTTHDWWWLGDGANDIVLTTLVFFKR